MSQEQLVETVIAVIEREVGHVGLYARIELERVVNAAIDEGVWSREARGEWEEFDGDATA